MSGRELGWRRAAQRWLEQPAPTPLRAPLGRAMARWNGARVVRPQPQTTGGRVVVVGGTTLGGAGRTAVVQWLAGQALAAGQRVAVVGHGYRATRRGRLPAGGHAAFGDDAALLAAALPGAWVETGDRARLAAALAETHDVVFTDGGLLDRAVRADWVIAVCDVTAPRAVVPAGPARVAVEALPPDIVRWAHRVDEPGAASLSGASVRSRVVPIGLRGPEGEALPVSWLRGRRVRPACAVGRPASFLHTLEGAGATLHRPVLRGDHEAFRLGDRPNGDGPPWVVTTKDAAHWPAGWPVYVLETTLAVAGAVPGVAPWR